MVDLKRTAYNVQPERISGGPSWLEWNRFDIAVLTPEKTSPDRLREMLKTLLAERFKLVAREESVTTTAMALKVKGAHRLKESSTAGGGCQSQSAPGPNGVAEITATCSTTMAQFVTQLPQAQSAYFPNRQQLLDDPGLTGSFDFQSKFTPRQLLGQAGSDGIPLEAALEKIGLAMEPKNIRVPAIAVDTATANFTPNAPGLARKMAPLPDPQFEVAVLEMSPPDANQNRVQVRPTGRSISAARR